MSARSALPHRAIAALAGAPPSPRLRAVRRDAAPDGRRCCVCLEDVNVGACVRTLPCLHTFHAECAEEWLKKKKVCPLCQFPIDGQEGDGGDGAAANEAAPAAPATT